MTTTEQDLMWAHLGNATRDQWIRVLFENSIDWSKWPTAIQEEMNKAVLDDAFNTANSEEEAVTNYETIFECGGPNLWLEEAYREISYVN